MWAPVAQLLAMGDCPVGTPLQWHYLLFIFRGARYTSKLRGRFWIEEMKIELDEKKKMNECKEEE